MVPAIVAFIAAVGAATPPSIPLQLELVRKPSVSESVSGTLTLTPAMGPGPPLVVACCDGEMTVSLPANSAWEMRPRLRGGWAAKEMIVVGDRPIVHALPLWPLARATGRIQVETGVTAPTALRLELLDPPAHKSGIGAGNTIDCAVESDRTFQCELPAVKVDLIVRADGFVPRQLWDSEFTPAKTRDLGTLPFRKGASVTGWIVNGGGAATVTLVPLVASGGATSERVARAVARTTALKNGFFQLQGIPAGQFVARFERPGYASETVSPVRVYGGRETVITKAVVLRPPVSVTVSVVPPRDWRGEPWRMWITKASALSGGFDAAPLFQGKVDQGRVTLSAQSAGRYSVDVFDSAGNALASEQFDADGGDDVAREIRVSVITVKGAVAIGAVPLETTLWFGGRHGAPHATMRSDGKGSFQGVLPHDGEWRVTAVVDGQDVETIADVRAHDGEAIVDLTLPDSRVAGVVVNGDGDPVGEADVTLATARTSMTHRTAGNGQFSFRAVDAGNVSVTAVLRRDDKLLTSDVVIMKLTADAPPPPLQLILRDGERLTGTVRSIHGVIAGAAVAVAADQAVTTATTDLDGHFTAGVPANVDRAYVTVRPPGCALRVFDVPLPNHGIGLNVPEGGATLDVVFPKGAGGNLAVVLFQDDRPLPLPELARWAMSHGTPPSDQGIHAADMAPGQYKACIGVRQILRRDELPRWIASARCVGGQLVPFGTLRLEIPKAEALRASSP